MTELNIIPPPGIYTNRKAYNLDSTPYPGISPCVTYLDSTG